MQARSRSRLSFAVSLSFCTFAALGAAPRGAAAQQIAVRLANPSNQAAAVAGHGTRPSQRAAGRRLAPVVTSSVSSFQGFVRCPAESGACTDPFASIPMDNGGTMAFYRDVLVGAYTFISGATDGEIWSSTFTPPAPGLPIVFGNIQFFANLNGQQNCFVSPFQTLCGSDSLIVLWFLKSQCQPDGTWTATFSNTTIPAQTFTFLPQIQAAAIPRQSQGDTAAKACTNYDAICRTNLPFAADPGCPLARADLATDDVCPCAGLQAGRGCAQPPSLYPWKIKAKGCLLTDLAMLLTYHGLGVDPVTLNTGFIGNGGYSAYGDVLQQAASNYASAAGKTLQYPATSAGSLKLNICTYGPQIVETTGRQHFVVAYGFAANNPNSVLVRDPGNAATASISTYRNPHIYNGPQFHFSDSITGLRFDFHSPVEVYVTDPAGLRAGFDPATQTLFTEIPNATYDNDLGLDDDDTGTATPDPGKSLEVYGDVDGDYTLTVTGTAAGDYLSETWAFDLAGNYPKQVTGPVPIAAGQVNTYLVHFEKADAGKLSVSGGFDGGGQRPRDVNHFLSYGNLASSHTSLPAGTASFPLFVFYGATTIPATFSATLNGADVTALFHPAPGTSEIVTLQLVSGSNVVKLSIDGNLPTRVATDSDRLVLAVP